MVKESPRQKFEEHVEKYLKRKYPKSRYEITKIKKGRYMIIDKK